MSKVRYCLYSSKMFEVTFANITTFYLAARTLRTHFIVHRSMQYSVFNIQRSLFIVHSFC